MANDGGPAFPVHPEIELAPEDFYGGMRLRDYFAAAALTGLVSTPESMTGMREVGKAYGMQVADYAASVAYEMADAMLAVRGKTNENP